MNCKNLIIAAALAATLISPALASPTAAQSAATPAFSAPEPINVVTPVAVPRRYQNETIRLSLTVDSEGRARNIQLLTGSDPLLIKRLVPALERWRFRPAMLNGRPVSADVVLPLELVDKS